MTLRIQRPFIATIAAAAIAITGFSAAPARASDNDAAKALAIVLGLAVAGAVIHKRNDDKKARRESYTHKPVPQTHKRTVSPQRKHVQPRPLPSKVNRKLLPKGCLSNLRTDRGRHIQAFGQNCLSRNYKFSSSLPQHCGQRVRTRHGAGYAYEAQCLSRQGYQLARR
ncbi:hypothetical protein [Tateyamaria sp.]|uniref:hypothetical protein n=1 Tax=Tateyamaria sp. TaxID=1929288 RepID=UPI00329BDB38